MVSLMKKEKGNMIEKLIDHTILKPYATTDDIEEYCRQAIEYGFCSVCVNPCHVKLVSDKLKNSGVKVCTVIGFPLGANMSSVKAYETKIAIQDGADEVDMVINIGALKEGNIDLVKKDIEGVVQQANSRVVKVIIETCFLKDEEKRLACKLAKDAGASFVKTSTGFGTGGATIDDVRLMKSVVGDSMGIKASGGIRDLDTLQKMVDAGATRIGTSSGVNFV